MDVPITPRSVFSIQKNVVTNKSLSISDYIGTNTVSGTPTMAIYDSGGTDVTANYGEDVSYASGVITFGVTGYDTGTFMIVFTVTYTDTTPSGVAKVDTFEMTMVVTAAAGSAGSLTASTAEQLETFALSTINDAKISMNIALDTTTDETLIVHLINNATYQIESYCRRRFKATAYTNELYDGNGKQDLFLDNYPINTISRLAIGTNNALRVKNTNAHTVGSVSVTSTSVVLRRNGSTDATLTFASNATITAMNTAINAVSGWTSEVLSSTYNSYRSDELLPQFGLNTINSQWANLTIPDDAEDEYQVYADQGRIHLPCGFTRGVNNVIVTYNAGYSTIPYDIRQACNMMTKEYYNHTKNAGGFKSENIGNYSYTLDGLSENTRKVVMGLITPYKRFKV